MRLQTGLAETARLLDQKMEQTSSVVHEQMEQLDRVLSSGAEAIKEKVEQVEIDHQNVAKVIETHAEVHTKFEEQVRFPLTFCSNSKGPPFLSRVGDSGGLWRILGSFFGFESRAACGARRVCNESPRN